MFSGCTISFALLARLQDGRLHCNAFAVGSVLVLAAVHAGLSLLPGGERFRANLYAHLTTRFTSRAALHRGGRAEQGHADRDDGGREARVN